MRCPTCRLPLEVGASVVLIRCPSCGARFSADDALPDVDPTASTEAGDFSASTIPSAIIDPTASTVAPGMLGLGELPADFSIGEIPPELMAGEATEPDRPIASVPAPLTLSNPSSPVIERVDPSVLFAPPGTHLGEDTVADDPVPPPAPRPKPVVPAPVAAPAVAAAKARPLPPRPPVAPVPPPRPQTAPTEPDIGRLMPKPNGAPTSSAAGAIPVEDDDIYLGKDTAAGQRSAPVAKPKAAPVPQNGPDESFSFNSVPAANVPPGTLKAASIVEPTVDDVDMPSGEVLVGRIPDVEPAKPAPVAAKPAVAPVKPAAAAPPGKPVAPAPAKPAAAAPAKPVAAAAPAKPAAAAAPAKPAAAAAPAKPVAVPPANPAIPVSAPAKPATPAAAKPSAPAAPAPEKPAAPVAKPAPAAQPAPATQPAAKPAAAAPAAASPMAAKAAVPPAAAKPATAATPAAPPAPATSAPKRAPVIAQERVAGVPIPPELGGAPRSPPKPPVDPAAVRRLAPTEPGFEVPENLMGAVQATATEPAPPETPPPAAAPAAPATPPPAAVAPPSWRTADLNAPPPIVTGTVAPETPPPARPGSPAKPPSPAPTGTVPAAKPSAPAALAGEDAPLELARKPLVIPPRKVLATTPPASTGSGLKWLVVAGIAVGIAGLLVVGYFASTLLASALGKKPRPVGTVTRVATPMPSPKLLASVSPIATPSPVATPSILETPDQTPEEIPVATPTVATAVPTGTVAAATPKTTARPKASPTPAKTKLKPSPQDLEFHTAKADTLLAEGRVGDAREEYKFILSQDPGWANAHYGLGRVLEAQGDAKGACKEYGQYLTLAPAGRYAFPAGKKMSNCK